MNTEMRVARACSHEISGDECADAESDEELEDSKGG
jgi:hypothetical protein